MAWIMDERCVFLCLILVWLVNSGFYECIEIVMIYDV